eukprot:COSAG01_NODE_180_length_22910_cov_19.255710_6_plen_299_part_00
MKAIDWGHGGETTVTGTPLAHYTVSPPTPVRTPRPPPPTALRRKAAAAAAAAAKSSPRASAQMGDRSQQMAPPGSSRSSAQGAGQLAELEGMRHEIARLRRQLGLPASSRGAETPQILVVSGGREQQQGTEGRASSRASASTPRAASRAVSLSSGVDGGGRGASAVGLLRPNTARLLALARAAEAAEAAAAEAAAAGPAAGPTPPRRGKTGKPLRRVERRGHFFERRRAAAAAAGAGGGGDRGRKNKAAAAGAGGALHPGLSQPMNFLRKLHTHNDPALCFPRLQTDVTKVNAALPIF